MLIAILVTWLVLPASYVVRGNGTVVELQDSMGAREEIGNFIAQFKDWRMLALFPMFFCSNYFYSYQVRLPLAATVTWLWLTFLRAPLCR